MSVEAMAWALDARRTGPIGPAARLTLVALADYANPENGHQAWPAAATLAARIGVEERSIRRHLAELLAAGLIVDGDQDLVAHIRSDRRPRVYRMALRRGDRSVTPRAPRPDNPVTPHGVTELTERGDRTDRHGVTELSPEPRTEPRTQTTTPNPLPRLLTASAPVADEPRACELCGEVETHDTVDCPNTTPARRRGCPVHTRGPARNCRACGTSPRAQAAYAAAVDAARARQARRRPDGSCRECDDVHPLGTPCTPPTPPPPDWRTAPPPEGALPEDQPLPLDDQE